MVAALRRKYLTDLTDGRRCVDRMLKHRYQKSAPAYGPRLRLSGNTSRKSGAEARRVIQPGPRFGRVIIESSVRRKPGRDSAKGKQGDRDKSLRSGTPCHEIRYDLSTRVYRCETKIGPEAPCAGISERVGDEKDVCQ